MKLIKQISDEIAKKRNKTTKSKDFGDVFRYKFPCKNIVRLVHIFDVDVQYFLIDRTPAEIAKLVKDGS